MTVLLADTVETDHLRLGPRSGVPPPISHAGRGRKGVRPIASRDGVVAQQQNYRKSGFAFAYGNVRYGGVPARTGELNATVALRDVPLAVLAADDARVFPADRPSFLKAWVGAPGHRGRALIRDGNLAAWGVIRAARQALLRAGGRSSAEQRSP